MTASWSTPEHTARDARVFAAFTLVLCGVATWDILSTLPFDFSIILRKRQWKLPVLLYFLCRFMMLLYVFSFAVILNTFFKIDCQPVTNIVKIADAVGTCGSTAILVLRTRAVWHQNLKVTIGLCFLWCIQVLLWALSLSFQWARSYWDPIRKVCVIASTSPRTYFVTQHSYSMVFNFIILILCTSRLRFLHRSSTLAHILLRDGIAYFCAVFIVNLAETVLSALNLNAVMNIMILPFTLVVSVIAATTVFRNTYGGLVDITNETSDISTANGSRGLRFSFFGGARSSWTTTSPSLPPRPTGDRPPPLDDTKSQEVGMMSLHRIVDITVSNKLPVPTNRRSESGDGRKTDTAPRAS